MTERERILSVYRGEIPDRVPLMLDLSHWYYQATGRPWDVSSSFNEPEYDLIRVHKEFEVGFYLPNLARFFQTSYLEGVAESVVKGVAPDGSPTRTWRLETKEGSISRERVWNKANYSWGISRYGIHCEDDLRVFTSAMAGRTYRSDWRAYAQWNQAVGDIGITYLPIPYSGVGMLMNNWLGVEEFIYASEDMPELLKEAVDRYNENLLGLVDLVCRSPAEVLFISDNFSSDVQPPHFFAEWSAHFYRELVNRVHAAGKKLAVHIDGKLKGAIGMIRSVGADAGDAITPTPMGDLTPSKCREEAGNDFILSGGIAPSLWLESTPENIFIEKVIEWLDLRKTSPRLILAAGDQVPVGTPESRIRLIRELVDQYGAY